MLVARHANRCEVKVGVGAAGAETSKRHWRFLKAEENSKVPWCEEGFEARGFRTSRCSLCPSHSTQISIQEYLDHIPTYWLRSKRRDRDSGWCVMLIEWHFSTCAQWSPLMRSLLHTLMSLVHILRSWWSRFRQIKVVGGEEKDGWESLPVYPLLPTQSTACLKTYFSMWLPSYPTFESPDFSLWTQPRAAFTNFGHIPEQPDSVLELWFVQS